MTEKTEWEVVDDASPHQQHQQHQQPQPLKMSELLRAMLGPWWAWKLAIAAIILGVALVFIATVAGVLFVLAVAGALLATAIAKFRQWRRSWR